MRMIDKAGGEVIGRQIKHPLQARIDEIVYERLGSEDSWGRTEQIKLSAFNKINNRHYVVKRLKELGFDFEISEGRFIRFDNGKALIMQNLMSTPKAQRVIEPKSNRDIGKSSIVAWLDSDAIISTEYLDHKSRRVLNSALFKLKASANVEVARMTLKSTNGRYSIYSLKQEALDDYAANNVDRLPGISIVRHCLLRYGVASEANTGLSSGSLSCFVRDLREQGWEIETLPRKVARATYDLISRP